MNDVRAAGPAPRFLFRDPADLQTPTGLAINERFLADEQALVRQLADAARARSAHHAANFAG